MLPCFFLTYDTEQAHQPLCFLSGITNCPRRRPPRHSFIDAAVGGSKKLDVPSFQHWALMSRYSAIVRLGRASRQAEPRGGYLIAFVSQSAEELQQRLGSKLLSDRLFFSTSERFRLPLSIPYPTEEKRGTLCLFAARARISRRVKKN